MSSAESPTPNTPEEEISKPAERVIDYVLVRHMSRSPRTRTLRAARSGHRRQGVLLDEGTRIRRKGKQRLTEIHLRDFVNNHTKLLEYVRVGTLEIVDPDTEYTIGYDDLVSGIQKLGQAQEGFELSESGLQEGPVAGSDVEENAAPGAMGETGATGGGVPDASPSTLTSQPTATKVEPLGGVQQSDQPPAPTFAVRLLSVGDPIPVVRMLRETGLSIKEADELRKELPKVVAEMPNKSDAEGLAKALIDAGSKAVVEDTSMTASETRNDMGASALTAAVDQHEAEMRGESNPPPSSEEEGHTEDELLKMSRTDLNAVAEKDYGVQDADKLPNKPAVVKAIFAASEKE